MTHTRIQREIRIINVMIRDFCRDIHGQDNLCKDCEDLKDYAEKKLLKCPFLKNKPVCSNCSIHCYSTQQKEKIKEVMRTVGPRMLYRHTWDTLWYFYYKLIHKFQRVT